ncbi:MAG: hypothetical protein KC649_00860, partial [Candidatus Omnitrophica bacterium]|nr:hypothetical protein [Candidatus Omnitrophota bacterium]
LPLFGLAMKGRAIRVNSRERVELENLIKQSGFISDPAEYDKEENAFLKTEEAQTLQKQISRQTSEAAFKSRAETFASWQYWRSLPQRIFGMLIINAEIAYLLGMFSGLDDLISKGLSFLPFTSPDIEFHFFAQFGMLVEGAHDHPFPDS